VAELVLHVARVVELVAGIGGRAVRVLATRGDEAAREAPLQVHAPVAQVGPPLARIEGAADREGGAVEGQGAVGHDVDAVEPDAVEGAARGVGEDRVGQDLVVAAHLELGPVLERAVADAQLVLVGTEEVVEAPLHVEGEGEGVGVQEHAVARAAGDGVAVARVHGEDQLVPGALPGPGEVDGGFGPGADVDATLRDPLAVERPRVVHAGQDAPGPVLEVGAPGDRAAGGGPPFDGRVRGVRDVVERRQALDVAEGQGGGAVLGDRRAVGDGGRAGKGHGGRRGRGSGNLRAGRSRGAASTGGGQSGQQRGQAAPQTTSPGDAFPLRGCHAGRTAQGASGEPSR
jgi:hypothetical protein